MWGYWKCISCWSVCACLPACMCGIAMGGTGSGSLAHNEGDVPHLLPVSDSASLNQDLREVQKESPCCWGSCHAVAWLCLRCGRVWYLFIPTERKARIYCLSWWPWLFSERDAAYRLPCLPSPTHFRQGRAPPATWGQRYAFGSGSKTLWIYEPQENSWLVIKVSRRCWWTLVGPVDVHNLRSNSAYFMLLLIVGLPLLTLKGNSTALPLFLSYKYCCTIK